MSNFFLNPGFMPHGYCLQWKPGLLWLHAGSDIAIALAYFSIPAMIIYYLRKRTAITEIAPMYLALGVMFAGFIVFCGLTHVLGLITLWQPVYGAQGAVKAATALVSVMTALAMIPILPRALTLRTAEELEAINLSLEDEVRRREWREQELKQRNQALQAEMLARSRAEDSEQKAIRARSELEQTLHHLKVTQARLVESEKLASLGKSMAGLAHEVNTPVGISVTAATGLRADTDAVEQALEDSSLTQSRLQEYLHEAGESIDLVVRNLERASSLLQSVKQIASDQASERRRHLFVRDYLELVLSSVKPRVLASRHAVRIDCPAQLSLETIPGAFAQVVTNLLLNALIHAYPNGEPGEIRLGAEASGDGIRLTCADDGVGIPEENLERIFEPFFTTRAGEGGSGIGLDLVRMLVTEKMHGRIRVRSEVGRGAEFEVELPHLKAGSPELAEEHDDVSE